jgi:hypothetical protein
MNTNKEHGNAVHRAVPTLRPGLSAATIRAHPTSVSATIPIAGPCY